MGKRHEQTLFKRRHAWGQQTYEKMLRPGMVAQVCNPSTLGGWGGWITRSRDWDHPGQHGEIPSLLKIQKISWAWWRVPVIPATQEAEVGEPLELGRRRLWWAEIAPLHSSLDNKSKTPSYNNNKNQHCIPLVMTLSPFKFNVVCKYFHKDLIALLHFKSIFFLKYLIKYLNDW